MNAADRQKLSAVLEALAPLPADSLCRDFGSLETRVSQRHLASYLGITPEHLSRIRRANA